MKKLEGFVPVTPAGTMLFDLKSKTEKEAIKKLLNAASHIPYKTWENFQKRGYTIDNLSDYKDIKP